MGDLVNPYYAARLVEELERKIRHLDPSAPVSAPAALGGSPDGDPVVLGASDPPD